MERRFEKLPPIEPWPDVNLFERFLGDLLGGDVLSWDAPSNWAKHIESKKRNQNKK